MHASVRAMRLGAIAIVLSGAVAVAGCGGGSSVSAPTATAPPATTTQGIPTAGGTVALPAATNGQAATLGIAAGAPAGIAITATSTTTAPSLTPFPSSVARKTQAVNGTAFPFFFVKFTVSADLAVKYVASQGVSLVTSNPLTAPYFVEFDDITTSPGVALGTSGPATPANGFVSFVSSSPSQQTGSLLAGHTYVLQFYYTTGASPSPTASPSAGPSATPTASPSPSPSPTSTATFAPNAQPSATASAGVSGQGLSSTTLTLPSLNNGGSTGAMTSGTYTGSFGDQFSVTYGNYFFGGSAAPTAPPSSGNVYAQVSLLIPSALPTPARGWSTVPPNMSLTMAAAIGKTAVTVRMWETWTTTQPMFAPMCLNPTTGAAALTVAPTSTGLISFPSPLTSATVTGAAATACTAPNTTNLTPLHDNNAGVWILVTDT